MIDELVSGVLKIVCAILCAESEDSDWNLAVTTQMWTKDWYSLFSTWPNSSAIHALICRSGCDSVGMWFSDLS